MSDNTVKENLEQERIKLFGMPVYLYITVLVLVTASMYLGVIDTGLAGSFAILLTMGMFFGEIGNRIPIWNEYFGGGTLLTFLAVAFMNTQGWIPEKYVESTTAFMKTSNFLALFIIVLITGSILSVNRKQLIKSLVGYVPAILIGIIGAMVFGIIGGLLVGIPVKDIVLRYVLPIMGGGNGGGAVPMSEIYAEVTGDDPGTYYSFAIAILTIGNIVAIFAGSLLNKLGKARPELTGNGELMRNVEDDLKEENEEVVATQRDIVAGLVLVVACYTLGRLFANYIFKNVSIHAYAYTVLFVALANITGIVPATIRQGAKKLQTFFSGQFVWVIMAGVGIAYTDLAEIINALTFSNLLVSIFIIVGVVLGTGFGGYLFGFYPIEAAITAGLCMANRGGSGDIAVLGAADRMDLISYGQISSRIGGGIMLVVASILFSLLL